MSARSANLENYGTNRETIMCFFVYTHTGMKFYSSQSRADSPTPTSDATLKNEKYRSSSKSPSTLSPSPQHSHQQRHRKESKHSKNETILPRIK
jgi:hypothetical protein